MNNSNSEQWNTRATPPEAVPDSDLDSIAEEECFNLPEQFKHNGHILNALRSATRRTRNRCENFRKSFSGTATT